MSPGSDSPDQFIAPSLEELQPLFPSYELEGFIAQGGMGAVYKATQRSLDRAVAIKILPREFGEDQAFRQAFTAEAKAMARLNHPSLIGVYDFGDVDGMLFIVMEFVGGGSLHDACVDMEVIPARAAELVAAICRGLAHAHEAGILHRDIKPGNILLTEDAAPKIGDFGLARRVGDHVDAGEPVYGTQGYAAPETCYGGAVDQRSDLFSVGVLLHRLLTGLEPDGGLLPLASSLCDCPPAFDDIIRRATQADPARRYPTAGDMAQDLENAKNAKGRHGAALLHVGPGAVEAAAHHRPAPAPRKSQGMLAAASLLLLAAIGGGAFFMNRSGDTADPVSAPPPEPEIVLLPDNPTPLNPIPIPREESLTPPEPEATPTESVSSALARLQPILAAGTRSEFPAGTVTRNENHFLVLDDAMSWPEAQAFATAHGAHLATFPTPEDQSWIREQLPTGQSPWIGAGMAGKDTWQWIDGSPWIAPASFSAGTGTNQSLALSASGELQAALPSQLRALILQWHDDGTNPGTLHAQLTRTAAALTTDPSAPLPYPVGTRTLEDSHFLAVEKTLTWDEARRLAESVGAHLAVPSSAAEHDWIRATFAEALPNGRSLWLGGSRPKLGDRWQWLSGEAWNNVGWAPDQPGRNELHNRIALRGGSGNEPAVWVAVDGNERKVEGLLLEWSPPREPVEVPAFVLKTWLDDVNRKIATRVGPDLDEFERSRRDLVQNYNRSMSRQVRKELDEAESNPFGRDRGGRGFGGFDWRGDRTSSLEALEESLKEAAKTNQLLTSLPERTSDALRAEHAKAQANIKLLEEACNSKLRGHLTFYLEGIAGKSADLIGIGYLDAARELNDTVAPLRDNPAAFVKALFPESPRGTLPWIAGPDQR